MEAGAAGRSGGSACGRELALDLVDPLEMQVERSDLDRGGEAGRRELRELLVPSPAAGPFWSRRGGGGREGPREAVARDGPSHELARDCGDAGRGGCGRDVRAVRRLALRRAARGVDRASCERAAGVAEGGILRRHASVPHADRARRPPRRPAGAGRAVPRPGHDAGEATAGTRPVVFMQLAIPKIEEPS